MSGFVSIDVQLERQAKFDQMAAAFARRDFDTVAAGVRPDVVLTLDGASWLAGTYQGYEAFSHYVLGAMQVLDSAGKRIEHLHYDNEMIIVDRFRVGGSPSGPEIALEVTVKFHADHRIESLLIHPRDQDAFDAAVDAFLVTRDAESVSVSRDSSPGPKLPRGRATPRSW